MKFTAAILSATLALAASLSARDRHILPSRPVCHGAVEVVDPRTFDRLYHNDHARIENVTCPEAS